MPAFFSAMNRKRPTGCSILIAGGDGVVTCETGAILVCGQGIVVLSVSGNVVDAVSNNHRRFWETLPHFLTGGMPYNYYPRGRVELRHGKAVVYLHSTLCTPEMDTRIRHAFCCRMRCRCRSKPTGAGITEYSGRNRRDKHWTYSGRNLLLYGASPQFFPWGSNTATPPPQKCFMRWKVKFCRPLPTAIRHFSTAERWG